VRRGCFRIALLKRKVHDVGAFRMITDAALATECIALLTSGLPSLTGRNQPTFSDRDPDDRV
jgi:hypothetical protein